MRALIPGPEDDPDVHEFYARDWLDTGGIRVNFVASVDGAASAGGLSAGLQTPGDNRIFGALRDLADVVLVGYGTVHAEDYDRPNPSGEALARRRDYGLADTLPLAILSRTGRGLTPDLPLFTEGDGARPIVVTTASADVSGLDAIADVLVVGDETVDFGAARRALAERGLIRVLCEGGPTIFGQAAGAGEVDELCLTVSPLLAGPGPGRIMAGDEWPDGARRMQLHGLLEEEGALFLRLVGERPQ